MTLFSFCMWNSSLTKKQSGLVGFYAFSLNRENAFFTVSFWNPIRSRIIRWCSVWDVPNTFYRFLPQSSGALFVTIVFDTPFLANTVLSTCFPVVAFLSVSLITSDHPKNFAIMFIKENTTPHTDALSRLEFGNDKLENHEFAEV